jgi:hypothetical protein
MATKTPMAPRATARSVLPAHTVSILKLHQYHARTAGLQTLAKLTAQDVRQDIIALKSPADTTLNAHMAPTMTGSTSIKLTVVFTTPAHRPRSTSLSVSIARRASTAPWPMVVTDRSL